MIITNENENESFISTKVEKKIITRKWWQGQSQMGTLICAGAKNNLKLKCSR